MSRLTNIANKTKNFDDIKSYKIQRNYVVNLNKNTKFEYFNRHNSSKPFWVSCKLYFSNKHSNADTGIMLTENGELGLKNNKVAEIFNEYFVNHCWSSWFVLLEGQFWTPFKY